MSAGHFSGKENMIDTAPAGNFYPTMNSGIGTSLGIKISAASAFHGEPGAEELMSEGNTVTPAGPMGLGGQSAPLAGLAVFVVLLFVLMFTASKIGDQAEFKNIKASFYNVLVITLAVIIGVPLFKFAFARVQVPGVSAWVASI